jgi:hypothetical protein
MKRSIAVGQVHNRNQMSPCPPIVTISETALTTSSHNVLSKPHLPCTPLNHLRTSSTALVRAAAPDSDPTTAIINVAATATVDEEEEYEFGHNVCCEESARHCCAGRMTQRRKSGAKQM